MRKKRIPNLKKLKQFKYFFVDEFGNLYSNYSGELKARKPSGKCPQYSLTINGNQIGLSKPQLLALAYRGTKISDLKDLVCSKKIFEQEYHKSNLIIRRKDKNGSAKMIKSMQKQLTPSRNTEKVDFVKEVRAKYAKGNISISKLSELYDTAYMTMNDIINRRVYDWV